MKFLEYSCFKPPQNTFPQSKSQCTWCPLFGKSPQPTQRSNHAVCVFDNQIFMYGGRGDKGTLNEFWAYDCDSLQWKELSTSGDSPPRLEGHSMVLYCEKIYIFGGETSFASADESPLWQYDINEKNWTKIGSSGAVMAPCGRRQHTAVLYIDAMCIHGGYQDLIGPTKEMWLFDFGTNSWHFDVAASCESAPDARYGHCSAVNNQSMWVCGGLTGLKPNSEVFVWNFELLVWISIKTKGGPSELSGHGICSVNNSIFVFGGCNTFGESSSDMWRLSLTDNTWKKCYCEQAVKPPAISGHCLIMYSAPMLFRKTELRTRSCPDVKKKRPSSKTPPTKQRSVSCGKLPNHSKFSGKTSSLECERKDKVSDKASLLMRQDTKVIYAYENPLTEIVDNDIEILPKFEPIPTPVRETLKISTGSKNIPRPFSASKSTSNLKDFKNTGYISSRKKYGNLAPSGISLKTFSYNLIEDSLDATKKTSLLETSFINFSAENPAFQSGEQSQQILSSTKLPNCDVVEKDLSASENTYPAITKVKPCLADLSDDSTREQWDTELKALDHDQSGEDNPSCSRGSTPDAVKEGRSSVTNSDITQRFQVGPSRNSNNDEFVLLVLGGKASNLHPNSNKPFSLWQCNVKSAAY